MINIIGKRYYFFLLSFILIVPGLILLAINGVPLSIDFKGGSMLDVKFSNGIVPSTEQVKNIYVSQGITDPEIQTSGNDGLILRSTELSETNKNAILDQLKTASGGEVVLLSADSVTPSIGKGVTERALEAVIVSAIAVVLYIAFAFRGVPHSLGYGVCAIIAEIHDILVVIALTGYGAAFFHWQVDSLYLTAVLTIIGFSVQDTIVVYDRLRENNGIYRKLDFEKLVNHSVVQTLQRSVNTLLALIFLLLPLALFGGVTLRVLSVVLLVGMISGSYSSIFIASTTFVVWEKKEWRTWFKRTPKLA